MTTTETPEAKEPEAKSDVVKILQGLASALSPALEFRSTPHWGMMVRRAQAMARPYALGSTDARLYADSMVEWTSNASRPIESARTKWDDLKRKFGLGS